MLDNSQIATVVVFHIYEVNWTPSKCLLHGAVVSSMFSGFRDLEFDSWGALNYRKPLNSTFRYDPIGKWYWGDTEYLHKLNPL